MARSRLSTEVAVIRKSVTEVLVVERVRLDLRELVNVGLFTSNADKGWVAGLNFEQTKELADALYRAIEIKFPKPERKKPARISPTTAKPNALGRVPARRPVMVKVSDEQQDASDSQATREQVRITGDGPNR